ncbi:hypothetical protein KP509_26G069000 [Ceratopteris richardii]|uniref:CCHC-type domain-containing protein n=1 Tax=Ceratopteris richardii TaxID=49495 RepID=A0A8T2RN48_CERRI|nr:hypothetical protein KP509_26G069000 [Ceratopteris richardii]
MFHEKDLLLFLTARIPLAVDVAYAINSKVGKDVVDKVFYSGHGLFEVIFNDNDTVFLCGLMAHVFPWKPMKAMKEQLLYKCPVWMELVDLPSFLWNSIGHVAKVLGKLLYTPSISAPNKNRVCVLWNTSGRFPKTPGINVPNVGGIVIYLKWGNMAGLCFHCGNLGHYSKNCPTLNGVLGEYGHCFAGFSSCSSSGLMKLATWNIQGLGQYRKWTRLWRWIIRHQLDLVAIQEHKKHDHVGMRIDTRDFHLCYNGMKNKYSGCLFTVRKDIPFQVLFDDSQGSFLIRKFLSTFLRGHFESLPWHGPKVETRTVFRHLGYPLGINVPINDKMRWVLSSRYFNNKGIDSLAKCYDSKWEILSFPTIRKTYARGSAYRSKWIQIALFLQEYQVPLSIDFSDPWRDLLLAKHTRWWIGKANTFYPSLLPSDDITLQCNAHWKLEKAPSWWHARFSLLWESSLTFRMKIFMWRIFTGHFTLGAFLSRHGLRGVRCPHCPSYDESMRHVLWTFSFTQRWWNKLFLFPIWDMRPSKIGNTFFLLGSGDKVLEWVRKRCISLLLWNIWMFKNKKLFQNKSYVPSSSWTLCKLTLCRETDIMADEDKTAFASFLETVRLLHWTHLCVWD